MKEPTLMFSIRIPLPETVNQLSAAPAGAEILARELKRGEAIPIKL